MYQIEKIKKNKTASLVWHPFPSLSTQFSQLPGPSVSFPQIQFAQTGVKLVELSIQVRPTNYWSQLSVIL